MTQPYATGEGWAVYNVPAAELVTLQMSGPGDLRDPRGRFHVITDPPYTTSPRTSSAEWNVTPEITEPLAAFVGQAVSSAVVLGSTWTSSAAVLAALPKWRRILALTQPLGTGMPPDAWKYAMQMVYIFGKARRVDFGLRPWMQQRPRSVARKPAVKPGGHPSPLDPHVGSWLAVGLSGQLVVDPFAGVGGLALGARAVGARVIAGEISEKYCEAMALRLEGETVGLWAQLGMMPTAASGELGLE